ncbi:hypothetical protein UK23_32770 [Lentzea aerocolonigenes]|uniref:Uncharacterized protein n=1 Tax=Lentzea aerocolonigenes TaxID=68170 RepID=A0A0F0GLW6_LENAE|nr:hypothetical protein [Lentzea aerocolonigenes]KJK43561.1 hypothetical protein UK23_32770 [Lentzea aerocolonigenes]
MEPLERTMPYSNDKFAMTLKAEPSSPSARTGFVYFDAADEPTRSTARRVGTLVAEAPDAATRFESDPGLGPGGDTVSAAAALIGGAIARVLAYEESK